MIFGAPAFDTLDEAYAAIVSEVLRHGEISRPRALLTKELIGLSFILRNPRCRYVSNSARRWSLAYAVGEFCWHTKASNSVDVIAWYAPYWKKVAGCSSVIDNSSYGAAIFKGGDKALSQWDSVISLLRRDRDTRRAVLVFSRPKQDILNPESDVSCTLGLQFILRNGRLDAICNMRSNDVITGLPYDVFFFTMLQEMAAVSLGCELGAYHHNAGSMHLYETHFELAEEIVRGEPMCSVPMRPMQGLEGIELLHEAELMSRVHKVAQIPNCLNDGYWSDLTKVITAWNLQKNLVKTDACFDFDDELISLLFSLRPFRGGVE